MAEGSSTSTDVKVLLQSLVTVVIIAVAGYFGMTLLGPRLAGLQPQAGQQPTLQAYYPPPEGSASARGAVTETVGEAAPDQGEATPADSAEPSVEEAATIASAAGRSAGDGIRTGQGPNAVQTSIAMGTPVPEGGPLGGRSPGDVTGTQTGTGVRLTAIAEGTMVSPPLAAGGEAQLDIEARMTAIAQGTFLPGAQMPAETPPAPQAIATDASGAGNASGSDESSNSPSMDGAATPNASGASDLVQGSNTSSDESGSGVSATSQQQPSAAAASDSESVGERLFAVTRGAGAGLYDRPNGEMLSELVVGSALIAMARSEDGLWVLVQSDNNVGWVPMDQLVLFDAESLPVASELAGREGSLPVLGSLQGTPTAPRANSAAAEPTSQASSAMDAAAPLAGEYIEPVLATVISQYARLNVRSGPGTDFDILARANPGEELIALARTPLNDWVQVALPDTEEGIGWVAADFVDLSDRIDTLPAAVLGGTDSPPVDLPTPTPVAAAVSPTNSQLPLRGDADTAADSQTGTLVPNESSAVDAGASALVLRKGPGPDFDVEAEVATLPVFVELERSADNAWARIALLESPGGVGWIRTEQLDLARGDTTQEGTGPIEEEVASNASSQEQGQAETANDGSSPAALPVSSAAAPVVATVITEGAFLRVRSGPGTGYEILDRLAPGENIVATARNALGDWVQISLDSLAVRGWVSATYVDLDAPIETLRVEDVELAGTGELATEGVASSSPEIEGSDAIGPPQFLPVSGSANTATAAADLGGTLVFESSNGGQIYGYDLETGDLWPITIGFDPAISPDGRVVAFTRDGGQNGLYLVEIHGGNERLIFSGGQRLASPKWSPDGSKIVFSRGDDAYECIRMGPGGCVPIDSLGDRRLPEDVTPSTWINYHLSVVDLNGNNFRDLATLESARAPDWNEGGIVYQSSAGLQRTSDEPNASNQLIVNDYLKPYFHDPDWQPGGGLIVYQGKEASHWELFSVGVDGSGVTALTHPRTALVDVLPSNVAPAWNPEGDAVVFLSNRTESGEAGEWRLWTMEPDGSNQRPLAIGVPLKYSFGDEQIVSWGPSVR